MCAWLDAAEARGIIVGWIVRVTWRKGRRARVFLRGWILPDWGDQTPRQRTGYGFIDLPRFKAAIGQPMRWGLETWPRTGMIDRPQSLIARRKESRRNQVNLIEMPFGQCQFLLQKLAPRAGRLSQGHKAGVNELAELGRGITATGLFDEARLLKLFQPLV